MRIMHCNGLGYDLQLDFSKFLQETRKHTNDAAVTRLESAKMSSTTKKKKTWIRTLSLLFIFREKKSGAEEAAAPKAQSLRLSGAEQKPPRSGPLFGNSRRFGQLHEKMGLSSSDNSDLFWNWLSDVDSWSKMTVCSELPTILVPLQPDGAQCGYFVLRYMREIIEGTASFDKSSLRSIFANSVIAAKEIDEVRSEWADCIQDHISDD